MRSLESKLGRKTSEKLRAAALKLSIPKPLFRLRLGLAKGYDEVFSSKYFGKIDALEVIRNSPQGRFLILGRGGAAKTVTVKKIVQQCAAKGSVPVLVTLRAWSALDYQNWERASSHALKIDYLLAHFTKTPTSTLDLDAISPDQKRVLVIDGLNEVTPAIGQDIIYAADDFVRSNVGSTVVLTDRLVRRSFDSSERWRLGVALPLTASVVQRTITKPRYEALTPYEQKLLTSPFFLNGYLEDNKGFHNHPKTRSDKFRADFEKLGLTPKDIDRAGQAAFDAYQTKSRTFEIDGFRAAAGKETVKRLLASGTLRRDHHRPELGYFDHHLKHDYLASRHLAAHPKLWGEVQFRTITFKGSSFDSIAMAMEQISSTESADVFLREVYDWNFYGTGYALAESGQSALSREMRLVILAMFSERRWDPILATAQKAEDTLSLVRGTDAVAMRRARSYRDIFACLKSFHTTEAWFDDWRESFIRRNREPATKSDFNRLTDKDSVAGWTTSNVMKRLALSANQQAQVRDLLRSDNKVVRWRAAHVLGAFPSEANVKALLLRLGDDSNSVRYGSIRSLVECAIWSKQLAPTVFSRLAEKADVISESELVDEFQRSVILRKAVIPPYWRGLVLPVIMKLQPISKSSGEITEWDRLLKKLAYPGTA